MYETFLKALISIAKMIYKNEAALSSMEAFSKFHDEYFKERYGGSE